MSSHPSFLPLEESVLLFRDLYAHQNCVCLDSTLFLVYFITPTFSIPAFSWNRFEKVATSLDLLMIVVSISFSF